MRKLYLFFAFIIVSCGGGGGSSSIDTLTTNDSNNTSNDLIENCNQQQTNLIRCDFTHQGLDRYYLIQPCLLYTSPSPRDGLLSRMPSSA